MRILFYLPRIIGLIRGLLGGQAAMAGPASGGGPPQPRAPDSATLLLATGNPGKVTELTHLLGSLPVRLRTLRDVGVSASVEESGATLEENAALKARGYARLSGLRALADDSGLEVDALGGSPGVHSARYGGEGLSDQDRVQFLLRELESVPPERRTARFRCVIALASPGEEPQLFHGVCEGMIASEPRGSNGFGYDPIFLLPELGRTMAELAPEEKDRLSHRAMAAWAAAHAPVWGNA